MKTLYEQLSDDSRKKLEIEAEKFPYGVSALIDILKEKNFYAHLTIIEALNVLTYLGIKDVLDIAVINELFKEE